MLRFSMNKALEREFETAKSLPLDPKTTWDKPSSPHRQRSQRGVDGGYFSTGRCLF